MTAPTAVRIECILPKDVEATIAEEFKGMVVGAGEVDPATLPDLYATAFVLGIARSANRVVGIGALKRPFAGHRRNVFRSAKSRLAPEAFAYELGWFHVLPDFQGNHISSRLVGQLIPWIRGESAYATSRLDNERMHSALIKHGSFVAEGSAFPSSRGPVPLQLFVRR